MIRIQFIILCGIIQWFLSSRWFSTESLSFLESSIFTIVPLGTGEVQWLSGIYPYRSFPGWEWLELFLSLCIIWRICPCETIYAKILVLRTVVVPLVSGYSSLSFPSFRTFMYLVVCGLRRHIIVNILTQTIACCCYFANIVGPVTLWFVNLSYSQTLTVPITFHNRIRVILMIHFAYRCRFLWIRSQWHLDFRHFLYSFKTSVNWWIPSLLLFTRSLLYSFIGTTTLQVSVALNDACLDVQWMRLLRSHTCSYFFSLAVLLAFLRNNVSSRNFLCRHELFRPRHNVWLLLFNGHEVASQVV